MIEQLTEMGPAAAFFAGILVGAVIAVVGLAVIAAESAEPAELGGYDEMGVPRFRHEKGQLSKDSERMIRIRDGKPTTEREVQRLRERGAL